MGTALAVIVGIVVVALIIAKSYSEEKRREGASHNMICPHCQEKGTVSLRPVRVKRGISGGKATGAVFTAGLSLLATGLSRKERHLAAHCSNCGVDWLI